MKELARARWRSQVNKGKDESYHFLYKGTLATIWIREWSSIKEKISKIKEKFDVKLASDLINFRDFKVIFGDKKFLENMKSETNIKIPEQHVKNEFEALYQWIINNVKPNGRLEIEIKRGNIIAFESRLNKTIGWLIQLIYSINGRIFQEARWAYKEIPEMKIKPKNCVERLESVMILGNKNLEMQTKIKILRELVLDFDAIIRKKYPHLISIKELLIENLLIKS